MILVLIPVTILCICVARQINTREHTTLEGIFIGILVLSASTCLARLVYAACVDAGMYGGGYTMVWTMIISWCVFNYFGGQFIKDKVDRETDIMIKNFKRGDKL